MKSKNMIFVLVLSLVMLLSSCAAFDREQRFAFNPAEYSIFGDDCAGNRFIPRSFDDLEQRTRTDLIGDPATDTAIIKCSVVGDSINRIIEPTEAERDINVAYGVNHVLTPVLIEEIYFAGKDVTIEAGSTYYLKEPFFYITKETPEYLEIYGENSVFSSEYIPMVKGEEYIAYVRYKHNNAYDYNGEATLSTIGLQESVYCITNSDWNTSEANLYQDFRNSVIEAYG